MSEPEKVEYKKISANHRVIHTEIIIEASPKEVWETLIDFDSYPKWASFFVGMEGEIKNNGNVTAYFQQKPNAKPIKVKHSIFYQPGKLFGWSEPILLGMKDNHQYIVEKLANGTTKFIQSDEIRGGVTWLLGDYICRLALKGYPAFNKSLKMEVEKRIKNK